MNDLVTIKKFVAEDSPASMEIQALSAESNEEDIKDAFIRYGNDVFLPIIDDILQNLIKELEGTKNNTNDAPNRSAVHSAIDNLKRQKKIYCEFIEEIAKNTNLQQFLTIMGRLSPYNDSLYFDGTDPNIKNQYSNILMPAIYFRYNNAREILLKKGLTLDLEGTYAHTLNSVLAEHEKQDCVKALDSLGKDKEQNAEILYRYYSNVLTFLVSKIFRIDNFKNESPTYYNLCKITPNDEPTPSFERLLEFLLGWENSLNEYLESLSLSTTQSPDYEPAKNDLLGHFAILKPHLMTLQIAGKVHKESKTSQSPDEKI
ncbi:MAG: hypothetical protein WC806_04130 [Candidatus Gracilibacteria bacterium]|jgi:hypothetical protein